MSEERSKPLIKKPYKKPTLCVYGSVKDVTKTFSKGGQTDGGAFPANKMMCITPAPAFEEHRYLLLDTNVQNSYFEILKSIVTPESVVVDLGTGSGIHTMFALRAGAKKVYAIELDPLIEIAKEVIARNGFSDRVEFFHADSSEVNLPEKADILIANVGFLESLESVAKARQRFLKPGGVSIPDCLQLEFTPVCHANFYQSTVDFWNSAPFGFDFSSFRSLAANHPLYTHLTPTQFLAKPQKLGAIPLCHEVEKNLVWSTQFLADRSGLMNGFGGWYHFQFHGDSYLSTTPPLRLSEQIWSHIFLPLESSVAVRSGDRIDCEISMHRGVLLSGPLWQWRCTLNGVEVGRQSSFQGIEWRQPPLAQS